MWKAIYLGEWNQCGNSDYGDINVSTRVTEFAAWIDDTITLVPEPATMLLFGTGLIAVIGYRRKTAVKKK